MRFPRPTPRRLLVVVALVVFAQATSSSYRRFLRVQGIADNFAASEIVCRRRAAVCEELSRKAREVASLAREVAKSASGDFERTKWLEMARAEDEKAARLEREEVQSLSRADLMATRADELYNSSWKPWEYGEE